jgi:hypothetical protein
MCFTLGRRFTLTRHPRSRPQMLLMLVGPDADAFVADPSLLPALLGLAQRDAAATAAAIAAAIGAANDARGALTADSVDFVEMVSQQSGCVPDSQLPWCTGPIACVCRHPHCMAGRPNHAQLLCNDAPEPAYV